VKNLIFVAVLLASTLAVCEKKPTGPVVTVRATSYTTVGRNGVVFFGVHSAIFNRTEITVSDHPGQTFLIESREDHLDPGSTYDGTWGKNEKTITVHCLVSDGYEWEKKKKWGYVKFNVVGRGV
jgi:hypothetical protein